MSATHPAVLELVDFLAVGTTPEALIAFRPSPAAQDRISELLARNEEEVLSYEDRSELTTFY